MTGFIEVDDGIDVPEVVAPQMFERNFTEYMSFEDTGLKREELPQPTLWRVLVLPKQPKKMSAGGIALPTSTQDAEQHLNYIAQVIAIGPLAGKSEKFQNPEWEGAVTGKEDPAKCDEPFPCRYLWDVKVGAWVLFGRYSGQVITFKGVRLLTLNDDDITNVVERPDGLKVWV